MVLNIIFAVKDGHQFITRIFANCHHCSKDQLDTITSKLTLFIPSHGTNNLAVSNYSAIKGKLNLRDLTTLYKGKSD